MDNGYHLDGVEVSHGIFTKEVKCDLIILFELDVLNSERTAAHCVSLILTFLVAYSQSKLIDEIRANTELVVDQVIGLHFLDVVVSNFLDRLFETASFLVLLSIIFSLDGRFSG